MTTYTVQPIRKQDAEEITRWAYEPPYAIYNLTGKEIPVLLELENRFFSIHDESGRLSGYCCFGEQARVPGGDYAQGEPQVLDLGLGMHPQRVGLGSGRAFVDAILAFGREAFSPGRFRVSIAAFNKRSLKTFQNMGFLEGSRFTRKNDGMTFVQLERETSREGET